MQNNIFKMFEWNKSLNNSQGFQSGCSLKLNNHLVYQLCVWNNLADCARAGWVDGGEKWGGRERGAGFAGFNHTNPVCWKLILEQNEKQILSFIYGKSGKELSLGKWLTILTKMHPLRDKESGYTVTHMLHDASQCIEWVNRYGYNSVMSYIWDKVCLASLRIDLTSSKKIN